MASSLGDLHFICAAPLNHEPTPISMSLLFPSCTPITFHPPGKLFHTPNAGLQNVLERRAWDSLP